jgi:hypothetical protein
MPTTFRKDVRAGMVAAVQAFVTANPTLLARVVPARPTSFTLDFPVAWIDLLSETATHTAGTRERVMAPSVVVMNRPLDNDQQVAAWDVLVDALADHFTSYPQFTPSSIWDRWTLTEDGEEIQTGDSVRVFPTVRFTFDNVSLREGRS